MLKLGSPFTNHAVFQRDKIVYVWGWTDGSSRMSVEFDGQKTFGISAAAGNFLLRIMPHEAGGPYEMTVRNDSTGETVVCNDILVGEVWLCSGQSNMQYTLGTNWGEAYTSTQDAREAGRPAVCEEQLARFKEDVKPVADKIRFFTVPMAATTAEERTCRGEWLTLEGDDCEECTAVGAWFGLKLHNELQMPIGLVFSAYGGTIVEAWTSFGALALNPYTLPLLDESECQSSTKRSMDRMFSPDIPEETTREELMVADPGNKGVEWGWAEPDFDDSDWAEFRVPGSWMNQKIAGNGVVWARFAVTIPENLANSAFTLHLGGIDKTDITYFNGVEVGRTGEGFDSRFWDTPREYEVPSKLVHAGRNVIAVRMYSFAFDGSMNGALRKFCLKSETEAPIPLCGSWKAKAELDGGIVQLNPSLTRQFGCMNPNTPAILFDTMLTPVLPYTLRGAIWYQGESNAFSLNATAGYASKLLTMVDDWRRAFRNPAMPLIQVELASYRKQHDYSDSEAWPWLRDEQRKACLQGKNIFMASAIDAGEFDDIHPQDKYTPGMRLADCALAEVYKQEGVEGNGPELMSYELSGNTVKLYFNHSAGMEIRGNASKSFFVADATGVFIAADDVTISGNVVTVKSTRYDYVRALRYAWADNPICTLYNGAGFPASPFRTDSWPMGF